MFPSVIKMAIIAIIPKSSGTKILAKKMEPINEIPLTKK
jgi:hypothetical protein